MKNEYVKFLLTVFLATVISAVMFTLYVKDVEEITKKQKRLDSKSNFETELTKSRKERSNASKELSILCHEHGIVRRPRADSI